jgi:hypothetical protein
MLGGAVRGVVLAVGAWGFAAASCAPSPKTVANVSTGIIGCPAEDLVVFNYEKATRTWSASCNDKLYVCSDGRGGARCTHQDPGTVDPESLVRANALLQLTGQHRAYFVDRDILQGDWETFAELVAVVRALPESQLEDVDAKDVYARVSEGFNRELTACLGERKLTVLVLPSGTLDFWRSPTAPVGPCVSQLLKHPELAPLKARPEARVHLIPGVFDVKPIARPLSTAAAAPIVTSPSGEAKTEANDAPASVPAPELDAAVRRWLDGHASSILACTGKESSALLVDAQADGTLDVTLRGAEDGAETPCVRHVLSTPPSFPPGAGRILHVVQASNPRPVPPPAASSH